MLDRPIYLVLLRNRVVYQERIYGYWDVLPRGRYIAVQCDPLRRDPLEGNSGRRRSTVDRSLVLPLNPVTCLLY